MKPYKEYKDSGIPWIGEIPKDWKVCKAKYVFADGVDSLKIGPFGSALKGKTLSYGKYKIYNQTNLIQRDFNLSHNFVSEKTYKQLHAYFVNAGDILFSMMGTIGKCCIMPAGYPKGIMDSHLLKTKLSNKIYPHFFVYIYDKDNSNVVIEQLTYMSNGTIMSGLNSSIVKNVYITLPDITNQHRIADYLDRKTSAIDTLIEDKQKMIELLKEQRQTIISEAVTKGLDKNVKMKDSGIEWIGKIPEDWEIKKVKYVYNIQKAKMPNTLYNNYIDDSEIYLSMDIIRGNFQEIYYSLDGNFAYENELLLLWDGSNAGEIIIKHPKGYAPSTTAILTLIINMNTDFAMYYMKLLELRLRERTIGMGVPHVDGTYLRNLPFLIPNIEIQSSIAFYLNKQVIKIDNIINNITTQIEKLKEYRQAIISEAVTGKVEI